MSDRCVLVGPGLVRCQRVTFHDQRTCLGYDGAGQMVEWVAEETIGIVHRTDMLFDDRGNPLWAEAAEYYKVIEERDTLNRVLALVAAAAWRAPSNVGEVRRLLTKHGFGKEAAEAIQGVIAWAQSEDRP